MRLALFWGGCFLYAFLFSLGLYGNFTAPRWDAQFDWEDGAWKAGVSSGSIQAKDELLEVAGLPATFETLLVDNAFLTTGTEFKNWLEVKRELYDALDGSVVEVQVLRGDKRQTLELPLRSRSWEFLKTDASSHLLVSLVFFLVGAAVFSPKPTRQVTIFYLLCLSMSLVYLTNAMSLMAGPVFQPDLFKLLNLLNFSQFILGPALLLHFGLLMPRERAPFWVLALIYLPATFAILTLGVETAGVIVPLFFLGSLVAIVQGAFGCRSSLERQQMKWVGTGFLLGVGPWFLINGLSLLVSGERLVSDTVPGACLIAIPIFMAVAVKRYRLFDVGTFLEGTLVYVLTLVVLLGFDLALLSFLGLDEQFGTVHLVIVGSLLALWAPLRGKLSSAVSRLIHREEVSDRIALDKLSNRLAALPFSECHQGLSQVVHELYSPSDIDLEESAMPTGAHLEFNEEATMLLVISNGLALRCGPLPPGRIYHSRAVKQLDILTKHCGLFYESGLRLKEKEALLSDLHDGVGSALAKIRLSSTNKVVSRLAQDALFELQSFLYGDGEYTFECGELVAEMRRYGNDFFEETSFSLVLDSVVDPGHSISRNRALSVFRLYREALANILKHSAGQNVSVTVALKEDSLFLQVSDDGSEGSVEVKGRGLKSMANRATELGGELLVDSENGFTVRVSIPL